MNTKRFSKLLFAALLVIAIAVAFQILYDPGNAMKSPGTYVGMGDIHRFEAVQALSKTNALAGGRGYVGMGDLHRLEAAQALSQTNILAGGRGYVGMGDLHRYEYQQEKQNTK